MFLLVVSDNHVSLEATHEAHDTIGWQVFYACLCLSDEELLLSCIQGQVLLLLKSKLVDEIVQLGLLAFFLNFHLFSLLIILFTIISECK